MSGTNREVVLPEGGAKPIGPYSPGIQTAGYLFVSGTTGIDPDTRQLVEGGVEAETRQALLNLSKVLEAGGSTPGNVVKTTVFMVDLDQFSAMNQVYAEFFSADPPARSTVQVVGLPGGASVEIEAIAMVAA